MLDKQKFLGFLVVAVGSVLFLGFMGKLIFRVLGGIFSLAIINQGLRLLGRAEVRTYFKTIFKS